MRDSLRDRPLFGSPTVVAHLLRGLGAMALFTVALSSREVWPLLSVAAAIAGMLCLRGCPACWTIGLLATIAQCRNNCGSRRASQAEPGERDGERTVSTVRGLP